MHLSFSDTSLSTGQQSLVGLLVEDPAQLGAAASELDGLTGGAITREIGRERLRAGKADVLVVPGGESGPERVVLTGVGPEKDGRAEAVRTAGSRLAQAARGARASTLTLVAPEGGSAADDLAALVEGVVLGAYRYDRFRSSGSDDAEADDADEAGEEATGDDRHPETIEIVGADDAGRGAAQRAFTIAEATNWGRDLANTPANHLTPVMLAEQAAELAGQHEHLTCTVIDAATLEREGYGLIHAVGKGSENEPRMIVLEWNPPGDDRADEDRLAFVGKAVTFDTGGISIKPSAGMHEMKLDKSGGCAVLGAMRAIAEVGVPRRVLAVVGAAENMPGSRAYKPGDVITAKDGTTVEVTNTDAEGRLVLGDSIAHARQLGCRAIVELSTLTGAMVIAMGHHFTGAIGRKGDLVDAVLASGERTGDPAWHLPMHDAYKAGLKSECADMVNSGPRPAGALYAGLFLEHFAKDTPFVHLDVAGTAMLSKPQRYLATRGASGWGVRLLTDLAASY
jgi:leucyl aminopeptidase